MCGILGYFSPNPKATQKAKEVITNLLLASEIRGGDASGLAFVKDNRLKCLKAPLKAKELVKTKNYKLMFNKETPSIVIGHTRLATKGNAFNNRNNHPIFTNGLAIVHNGVITNDDNLFLKLKLTRDGQVDSEIIVKLIDHYLQLKSTKNTLDAIIKMATKVNGSMALALINKCEPETLYLLASGSPLCLAYHKPSKTIFFASETDILQDSLLKQKNYFGLFFEPINDNDYLFYEVKPDDTVMKITKEGIVKKPITRPDYSGYYNNYGSNYALPAPKKSPYFYGFNEKETIYKPSLYSTDQLEQRLDVLLYNTENGILTDTEEGEKRRISNALDDRDRKALPPISQTPFIYD